MAHIPKYEQVKAKILADIRSGVYLEGERIPTREQLVEKYCVTRTTIGQALKILVNAGVLATSKRGGTVVTGKRMPLNIAFISTLDQTYIKDVINSSESEHTGIFKPLLEVISEFKLDFIDIREVNIKDLGWSGKYDFMVWVMPNDEILAELPKYKDKVLVINRYANDLNYIATNHRQAVKEMTEYNLKQAGKDCQVFFLNSNFHEDFIWRERREGFVDACQKANIFYRICDLQVKDYCSILDSLMDIEFDPNKNIVMISPCLAYTGAVLQMVQKKNLKFYENFFYSDFDNRHSMRNTGIQIVSAIQDYDQMGRELVEALRSFSDNKIQIFVPYEIVK